MKLFRRYMVSVGLVVILMTIAGTSVVSAQVTGEIEDVWVDHNVYEDGVKGMRIHVRFTTHNMRGADGRLTAYFYFRNGDPLQDFNDRYSTSGGNVAVGRDFSPSYASSIYDDFELFMPYRELHMAPGEYELMFNVVAFHELGSGRTAFARSDYIYFVYDTSPGWDSGIGDQPTENLSNGFLPDPFTLELEATGRISASTLDSSCSGYITSEPDFTLHWDGRGGMLRFFVTGNGDSVIVISDPNDEIFCGDDSYGTLNPTITFSSAIDGRYDVWVGTYSDDNQFDATLNVTELSSQHP